MRKDKGKRILTALSLPVIAALVYIYEKQGGSGMKCLFHSYTGLYCPGCGSGRAVHALFEGRIAGEFKRGAVDEKTLGILMLGGRRD